MKLLPLFLLLLAGCAFAPRYDSLERQLAAGDFAGASSELEGRERSYGKSSKLLYYFDRAWAHHLAGDFARSNEFVEKAHLLVDELYTRSVSGEALSFLGNDMSLPYQGESFERVMLHTVGMLNYARLGNVESALVEARRADERLEQYATDAGVDKVAYQEDALSRYLAGALYETQGGQQRWDAFIDYKKADEAFGRYGQAYGTPKPKQLERDLGRLARTLGEKWEGSGLAAPDLKGKGEVIVLLHEGLAPVKVPETLSLPVRLDDGTQQYFQASFPRFVPRQTTFAAASLRSASGASADFELFQDVTAIAIRDLADRVGLITLKTIARATAKFQAARAIQKKAREQGGAAELLAFLGTNIYNIVSEQADTRSWRTLPGRILLARLPLEPGRHSLTLSWRKGGGGGSFQFPEIEVKAGSKAFLEHSIY